MFTKQGPISTYKLLTQTTNKETNMFTLTMSCDEVAFITINELDEQEIRVVHGNESIGYSLRHSETRTQHLSHAEILEKYYTPIIRRIARVNEEIYVESNDGNSTYCLLSDLTHITHKRTDLLHKRTE